MCMAMHGISFTGPQPPADVSVVVTGNDTAVVSWVPSMSRMCDVVIGNYSVRYRLRNGTGATITVYSSNTSVTLQALVPNAEYNVSVAAINSIGNMSAFSPMVQFRVTLSSKSNMFKYLLLLYHKWKVHDSPVSQVHMHIQEHTFQ